jgi:LasA protease
VYGPGYADFDVAGEVARHPGLLSVYTEVVDGRELSGAEIVLLAAEQYSVGPRVLLALLELRGEWLSNPAPGPTQQVFPLGYDRASYWDGLYMQLCQAADALNTGFYGWWLDEAWLVQTRDGAFIEYSATLNAATAAVQKVVADTSSSFDAFAADLDRFAEIYERLFGDPDANAVEPLISPYEQAPVMQLPWASGETWYFTGGPHSGWGTLGALSAVDFVSDERNIGCAMSQRWVTAAADGRIVVSDGGMVLQELDDDGYMGTGWVILYMHMASDGRVAAGAHVKAGDPIGHPSCEGGVSDASHLHLARRLNGVWIAADDPNWPMCLSDWTVQAGSDQYEGTLVRRGESLTACECWETINGVSH